MLKYFIFGFLVLQNFNCFSSASLPLAELADINLNSVYPIEENSELTVKCFQEYLPKLTALTQQYEQSYNACLALTSEREAALNRQFQADIDNIRNTTRTINLHFDNCSAPQFVYNLFECYYNAAKIALQAASDVQLLSNNKMKYVRVKEEIITYNQTMCTGNCSYFYNQEYKKLQSELQNCLADYYVLTVTTVAPDDTTKGSTVPVTIPTESGHTKKSETTTKMNDYFQE